MRMCTRVGSGHTRCSRKCPELLELPTELKPARETESNEWSDHGEFPKNYPRVMNLRGVGNPRPCVEPDPGGPSPIARGHFIAIIDGAVKMLPTLLCTQDI